MSSRFTLESLKNYVLLDWIRFLISKEVVSLCCTSQGIKEVLDSNYSVWEHCLSVQPLFVKSDRMVLPRIQRNRQCCVWHLYLWHKIETTASFTYLLSNMDSYSFSSGLVRSTFRRIQEMSGDESMRYGAHKLQLHEMISKHLLSTDVDDVEEVVAGLEALKVLSRPFISIIVHPDLFAASSPSASAQCVLRAILVHHDDLRILEAAFNASTNMALNRNYASCFISEGFIDVFRNLAEKSSVISSRVVLLAGLNSLKNIYDPLHISPDNLEAIVKITIIISRQIPNDTIVIKEYISHLNQIAVWQAPHMQSQDIMELLSDIIADTERERADIDIDPSIIILKAVTSDLYQKIFQNMIP